MTSKDYLALVDVAQGIVATHIPNMAYRTPGEHEQYSDTLTVDGSTSGAIDMLSPTLRANFEDMLEDACHLLSLTFRRAVLGVVQADDAEEEVDDEDADDDLEGQG